MSCEKADSDTGDYTDRYSTNYETFPVRSLIHMLLLDDYVSFVDRV
jgi:hypothetical protein